MVDGVIEQKINEVFETKMSTMVDKKMTEAFERMNTGTSEGPRVSVPPKTKSARFHFE